jgi:hypothetical protein
MKRFILTLSFCLALASAASAEEFYCEVMDSVGVVTMNNQSVSGQVLKEGDILKVDDVVQVGSDSYVDLAYDREWNNVTRVEENSKIRIRSLYPTTVELQSGGLYAKLKSLPKESSFDVQTPTAIASVRGTEYRTTFLEGETQIYNLSDSDVYVYGLDDFGKRQAEPVIIRHSEKTQVTKRGDAPRVPHRMETHELQRAEGFRRSIENKINQNIAKGRVGKIQDLRKIEKAQMKGKSLMSLEGEKGEENRSRPKVLSSEEAHRASGRITRRNEDSESFEPRYNQAENFSEGQQDHRLPESAPRPKEPHREPGFVQPPFGPDAGRRPKDHEPWSGKSGQSVRKTTQGFVRPGTKTGTASTPKPDSKPNAKPSARPNSGNPK